MLPMLPRRVILTASAPQDNNGDSGWGLQSIGFQDVRSGASFVFPWRSGGRMGYGTGRETLSEPGQSEQRLTLHVGPDQDGPVFDGSVYVQLSGGNGVFCEEVRVSFIITEGQITNPQSAAGPGKIVMKSLVVDFAAPWELTQTGRYSKHFRNRLSF